MRMMDTMVFIRIKYFSGGLTIYVPRDDIPRESWDDADEDSKDKHFLLDGHMES